jgi:uncharacterized protein YacL
MVRIPVTKENKKRPTLKEAGVILRTICAVLFFSLGFFVSKASIFPDRALFGTHTVVEVLVGGIFSIFGYFIFPLLLVKMKYWLEGLVVATVSSIVTAFWDQQSKRIQQARRDKQKTKSEEKSLKEKQEIENAILLDTSVLVDGRLLDVVKAGFMDRPFIIPQNVINELQKLSDTKSKVKRNRGRMGLDLVKELKKRTRVLIPDIKTKEKQVDRILIEYAKEKKVKLMTMDFNLNKVAKVSGIKILNLNDLVNALKTVMLPGEDFNVKVLQQGKEKRQGIGYLSDGTMVILENGIDKVGQDVSARVLKVIQSSAGKIVFSEMTSK